MDSAPDTVEALSALGLGALSREWIDEAWEQNFAESVSLPDGSEGLLLEEKWQSVLRSCRGWLQSGEGTPRSIPVGYQWLICGRLTRATLPHSTVILTIKITASFLDRPASGRE